MDIFSFLNSRDIREHLQSIDYRFSPVEAAWVIYSSINATLAEKHDAWRELMETAPDTPLPELEHNLCKGSLRQMLTRYLELEDRLRSRFYDTEGCVYRLGLFDECGDFSCWQWGKSVFSSPERVRMIEEGLDNYSMIQRLPIDCPDTSMEAWFDPAGNLLALDADWEMLSEYECSLRSYFDELYLEFPVPFRKGDLLCFPRSPLNRYFDAPSAPFVFLEVNHGHYPDDLSLAKSENQECYEEMAVWGYWPAENGGLMLMYQPNYMDCEYDRSGKSDPVLTALGQHLRRELGLPDLLDVILESRRAAD